MRNLRLTLLGKIIAYLIVLIALWHFGYEKLHSVKFIGELCALIVIVEGLDWYNSRNEY